MIGEVLQEPALGRPFTLGMLYNASKDQLLPGVTLWSENLEEMTLESNKQSSNFEITASDSLEKKASLMDISGSMTVGFLSGLIEVSGSARYLSDMKKSNYQGRVSFQYKATTVFKQLMVPPAGGRNAMQLDDKLSATHVVTGILYGANAFFVFDSEKIDASDVQKIQGKMEAVIKKIPSFSIGGEVNIDLSTEEKEVTDKFTCKFYGDFLLESNPATFEDAVKAYATLPTLLGENKDHHVPLMVWMMPLKELETRASNLVMVTGTGAGAETETETAGISPGLVRKTQDVLEDFHSFQMRSTDYLDSSTYFQPMRSRLHKFQKMCEFYVDLLKNQMKEKLPPIKAGDKSEEELKKIFEKRERSPFSSEKLRTWMDATEREVGIVESCVKMMPKAKVVPNETTLREEILDPHVEEVLCFVFTSLKASDLQLEEMSTYLDSLRFRSPRNQSVYSQNPWYLSADVIANMRRKAKEFGHLAAGLENDSRWKFLVAAVADEDHQGASVYHYRNTQLVTTSFSKPKIPDPGTVTDRRVLMSYGTYLSLDPGTANVYLVLSDEDKRATHGDQQSYPDVPQRFSISPQVLCRQALTGRHYWEVEWSVGSEGRVAVGVAYDSMVRKGGSAGEIGLNNVSWSFGHKGGSISADHDDQQRFVDYFPSKGFTRVGVYLDWPVGMLSFYKVAGDIVSHVYTFKDNFTEPLYPAFLATDYTQYTFLCL